MATKTICDNCGDEPAHRVTANFTTSGPKDEFYFSDLPPFDVDLCRKCFNAFKRTLTPVLLPAKKPESF